MNQCSRAIGALFSMDGWYERLSLYWQCHTCCGEFGCYCKGLTEACVTTCSQVRTATQCQSWTDVWGESCIWDSRARTCQSTSGCFPLLGRPYNAQPYLLFVGSVLKDILTLVFLAATGERIAVAVKRLKRRYLALMGRLRRLLSYCWRQTPLPIRLPTLRATPVTRSPKESAAVRRVVALYIPSYLPNADFIEDDIALLTEKARQWALIERPVRRVNMLTTPVAA